MTLTQALGVVLIAIPFVVVIIGGAHFIGWRAMLAVLGITAAIVALIGAGVYLL